MASVNILLIHTNCSWNKGSAAQVFSTMTAFKQAFGDCNFTLLSTVYERDLQSVLNESNAKLNIIGYPRRLNWFAPRAALTVYRHIIALCRCALWKILSIIGIPATPFLKERYLSAFNQADLVVDLSGDSFADYDLIGNSLYICMELMLAILLQKPFVIYSQSLGPFNWWSRPLVRFCLKKANAIILREEISLSYLRSLKVGAVPTFLKADCAFALDPASSERVQEIMRDERIELSGTSPLIGIGISRYLEKSSSEYVAMVTEVIDHLTQSMDARVLLVSHVFDRFELDEQDDRYTAKIILTALKNKTSVKIIQREYTPSELKGIIGCCDLFIGSRMHANIAALSMSVPTITIGWSHKYHGIMASFGLECFAFDYRNMNIEGLVTAVNQACSDRLNIHKSLQIKSAEARASALEAGEVIKRILTNSKR